ncbi:hypothetical protein [Mesonia aestuariivivens]|uniref:hypothetical protein n=1 Tax=Mesonia aestuariivivens TaxID=2796128 RepID=UPI0021060C5C|nr:hypothetical protein [Mesonia aestuariivivens]
MIIKRILQLLLVVILTILTQVGGIIYILSSYLNSKLKRNFKGRKSIIFLIIYLFTTFVIIPFTAPLFGREAIVNSEKIKPTNFMTILCNRNYVKPEMNKLLKNVEYSLKDSNIEIHYLDANFPFIDKFPLLPHLSHNDGKKIDLSLIYESENGKISNEQKSVSGYGSFVEPRNNEFNQIEKCLNSGYFQYDYPKYLTLGKINPELNFSENGTKKLIESILVQSNIGKIFIEPHLKNRLKLKNNKIRYHGCRAVRHDDHIHIQLK